MTSSNKFGGRTLIYSNRPPTAGASGGAQVVIEASNPTWWIGPESIKDKIWNVLDENERIERTLHNGNQEEKEAYDTLTFPTPKSLETDQYQTISNEIFWPVAHSIEPNTTKTIEEIEEAYFNGYLRHNEIANVAIRSMVEDPGDGKPLDANDRIWVHDYQCNNVPGAIFSNHIPWPELNFLEKVTFKNKAGDDVKLLDTQFYRDHIELMSSRTLSTFQRPVDQANFIMTAAYVAGLAYQQQYEKDAGDNPALTSETAVDYFHLDTHHSVLQNLTQDVRDPEKWPIIQQALLEEISIGTMSQLTMFGDKMSLINVPVGLVTDRTYEEAKRNEDKLTETSFSRTKSGKYNIFHASVGNSETVNLTASDPHTFSGDNQPTIEKLVEPIRGRDWVFSIHRNDYTKGTLTKLEAAEIVLKEEKEKTGTTNTTFLFVLQPTRADVAGYKEYAENVFKKAHELREKYGKESVVIIPEAVKNIDILGLMRQPEMRGFLSLGHKDGHDLTVREMVDSNEPGSPIGIVTSSGIGASDVLGEGKKGAFVIADPKDPNEVANALKIIINPENRQQLSDRFTFMKQRSLQYNAENFAQTVNAAYPKAMAYRYGGNWRETFVQPINEYVDRKGGVTSAFSDRATSEDNQTQAERPAYISEILTEGAKPKSIKAIIAGLSDSTETGITR